MRILHIIDDMGMGGAQSLLAELAPIQKQMGNEVTILELQSVMDRTLVQKIMAHGIIVKTISTGSVRNPINILKIIPYLRNVDIVHVHLFPANYWSILAGFLSCSKKPFITTEHSTDNKRRRIKIFKYIDRFIYSRYSEVIACSDKALDTFSTRFPTVKCLSIPNGVDIMKYEVAQPYSKLELLGIPEDSIVVTMVARFCYPKRQDILIKALNNLPKRFHVVFVGGSKNDEGLIKVKNFAKELKIEENVHFLYIRPDVPRILKTSDFIVMSSEYEGLSLSSIEGMAVGKPFIASDVQGLREVVSGAGILFKLSDYHQLSELILMLDNDKNYYEIVKNRCLLRAREYDIRITAKKYQREYEHLIGTF